MRLTHIFLGVAIVAAMTIVKANASVTSTSPVVLHERWSTELQNASDPAAPRSGYCGRWYCTTDIAGRLYAINTTDGSIGWTFNHWVGPTLNSSTQSQRMISGSWDMVVVFRGRIAYGIDAATGKLSWTHQNLTKEQSTAYFFISGDQIAVPVPGSFQLWDLYSGKAFRTVDNLWTPAYGTLVLGNTNGQWSGAYIGMVRRGVITVGNTTVPSPNGTIILMHNDKEMKPLFEIPVSGEDTLNGTFRPCIFQVRAKYMFYLTAKYVRKVTVPEGKIVYTTYFDFMPSPAPAYGLGTPYFFIRSTHGITSYNKTTGAKVASMKLPEPYTTTQPGGFQIINHLWGYNGFAVLGLLQNNWNASNPNLQMNVTAWDGKNLTLRYGVIPSGSGETAKSLVTLYGNGMAEGTVVAPSLNGMTMIGASGCTWSTTKYPHMVGSSVSIGSDTLTFAHGSTVVSMSLPPQPMCY